MEIKVIGTQVLISGLGAWASRLDPDMVANVAGKAIEKRYLPDLFDAQGFGAWAKPKLRQGQTLWDSGILRNSWLVKAAGGGRVFVTNVTAWYGLVHDKPGGTVITPKRAKVLVIPNPAYWGNSERRAMTIREMYDRVKGKKFAPGEARPFFFAKRVTIPYRPITKITPQMTAVVQNRLTDWIQYKAKKENG